MVLTVDDGADGPTKVAGPLCSGVCWCGLQHMTCGVCGWSCNSVGDVGKWEYLGILCLKNVASVGLT